VTKALPGDELQVSGPGLIDTTRLAQSPYEIWRDILLTNRGPVDQALAEMIAKLEEMRQALGENEAQFAEGAELRRRILRSVNFS
jgi:prephenate dehydrogenase